MRSFLAGIAAVVVMAGCSSVRNLTSFPRSQPAEGGAVFKYKSVQDTGGFRPEWLWFKFAQTGADKTYGTYAKIGKGALYSDLGAEVEEMVLVSLPPGEWHLSIIAEVESRGTDHTTKMFWLDPPGGAFAKFQVEPGKVVSLGKLDLLIKVVTTGDSFTWKDSKVSWDDRADVRKAVAREALEDKRAEMGKWTTALETLTE